MARANWRVHIRNAAGDVIQSWSFGDDASAARAHFDGLGAVDRKQLVVREASAQRYRIVATDADRGGT